MGVKNVNFDLLWKPTAAEPLQHGQTFITISVSPTECKSNRPSFITKTNIFTQLSCLHNIHNTSNSLWEVSDTTPSKGKIRDAYWFKASYSRDSWFCSTSPGYSFHSNQAHVAMSSVAYSTDKAEAYLAVSKKAYACTCTDLATTPWELPTAAIEKNRLTDWQH